MPGSGEFSATFGVSYSQGIGNRPIRIVLVPPKGSAGTPTTVTVSQFHEFTLGASNSSSGKTEEPGAGIRRGGLVA